MTRAQERARARRRYEHRQKVLAQREAAAARNKRVVAVVVAVLVVVGGLVAVSGLFNHKTTTATPTTSSPATNSIGCPQPPASLGTGAELTMPSTTAVKGKIFTAVVGTNCGDLTFTLDGAKAPLAVASFKQLAEKDYWLNAPCHRLTTSGLFVLQCGDPTGTGQGTPGYGFAVENAPKDDLYPRGTLAMARPKGNTKTGNGGQFFIVYKDTTLPDGYTIFGQVTGGMDIVDKIAAAGVSGGGTDGSPAAAISMLHVSVTEKKG